MKSLIRKIAPLFCAGAFGGLVGSQFVDNTVSVNDNYLKSGGSLTITHVDGEPVSRGWKIFSPWSQPDAKIEPGLRRVRFSVGGQEDRSVEVSYEFLGGLEYRVGRNDGDLPSFIVTKI